VQHRKAHAELHPELLARSTAMRLTSFSHNEYAKTRPAIPTPLYIRTNFIKKIRQWISFSKYAASSPIRELISQSVHPPTNMLAHQGKSYGNSIDASI
jgi:hypothetical protein